jgi:uncharacterized membrane protein YeaQ/YmgE (transglycosylase-associated protein family)
MDTGGIIVLIVGAIAIAIVVDAVASFLTVHRPIGYEVILTMIGALVGGFVASEYLGSLSEWGYEYAGLYVFPAAIGAFVVGLLVELVMRVTETRYRRQA